MTEEEFLTGLPDPGEAEATIVLPDFAALKLASGLWAGRLVEGTFAQAPARNGETHRTFRGRLTHNGALRVAELREGLPA